ncbi:hypothetical protein [Streptococcus sp.]|uniref:hypothetical protein n=1 Tax=Streptococcus sp. TaxID=1306 RepID=UPI0026DC4844|nr:hypothetical protein [Streptococcus sp.]MDO4659763.1 hypothetical protein [Streptococcus sp.]
MGTGFHGGFGRTIGTEAFEFHQSEIPENSSLPDLINQSSSGIKVDDLYVELITNYKGFQKGLVGIVLSEDDSDTYKVKFFTHENEILIIITVPKLLLRRISFTEFKAYFI